MKYKYVIRIKSERLTMVEWYVYTKEQLFDALKFVIEDLMQEDYIVTIERSDLDEQE